MYMEKKEEIIILWEGNTGKVELPVFNLSKIDFSAFHAL